MAKKRTPAAARTIGLFTGKTDLEQAEDMLAEEAPQERAPVDDLRTQASRAGPRWLEVDEGGAAGDSLRVAVAHGRGAVLVLFDSSRQGEVYGSRTFRLSWKQWLTLLALARGPESP